MTRQQAKKSAPPPPATEAQLKEFFKKQDVNGDGQLDKAELKAAFNKLGAFFPAIRTWLGLHYADSNGDGCINEQEIDALAHYAYNIGYVIKQQSVAVK